MSSASTSYLAPSTSNLLPSSSRSGFVCVRQAQWSTVKFRDMSNPITGVFNDGYINEAYEAYRRDPASVDESWRQFFRVAEQLAGSAASGGYDASLLRKA